MDDERTKQALDDLADLFLTGISPDGTSVRRAEDNPLDAPPPIRLRPKVSNASPPPEDGEDQPESTGPRDQQQVLDAVTGAHRATNGHPQEHPFLRLADEQSPQAVARSPQRDAVGFAEPTPTSVAQVEAVLLGNLPVVSGPWLQQYAQTLADQAGPVALLHVAGERIELDVVEPKDAVGQVRPVIDMGRRGDRRPPVLAMLEALTTPGEHAVTSVLVHVEPALDGSEALRLFALDDWTLLCGADDASIISAYRMLKQRTETDVTVSDKHIGLMVMGADEPAARAAAKRISTASESFLNTPVQLLGWQKQMTPTHVRRLGAFQGVNQVWPKLCDWFATLERPQVDPIEAPPTSTPEVEVEKTATPPPQQTAPTHQTKVEVPKVEVPRRRSRVMDMPSPAAPKPRPQREPAPKSEPAPEPEPVAHRQSPIANPPSLASLIETLPGSVALEARCPHPPGAAVEIVLDQKGVLHLLHRQTGELDVAVTELLTVRQWVFEHRKLLAMTQRQLKLDAEATPVLHLFTERAELATTLVARLGNQLKLHLLRQVAVGEQSTWFCAPLN